MKSPADLLNGFRNYLESLNDDGLSRFSDGFNWEMTERKLAPRILPVVGYLETPAPNVGSAEMELLAGLKAAAGVLQWGQTYGAGDFGADFLERYGWVELFGTRGHFESGEMAGGFLMLGPEIVYPDHHHVAEEIYIPLTEGSLWSKDGGAFQPRTAGEIIHHPSDIRHAMQTRIEPLVAIYLWRGGPLAQKSIISGRNQ
ncbi:dimethylsulfonioproprionate lyase family protein [Rhizobium tubonense]|uniref:Transcriptional regulator n=1 Tax=Rhizobium tubonense TaxID=484088 RepID=A0A2W4EFA3_9HYPH|nr:dimethylsulfonioproprionate lyase family protein [Rhizobium tubonense]PZM13006.1 transcriptional regulator [Rhizobium tubonense]